MCYAGMRVCRVGSRDLCVSERSRGRECISVFYFFDVLICDLEYVGNDILIDFSEMLCVCSSHGYACELFVSSSISTHFVLGSSFDTVQC